MNFKELPGYVYQGKVAQTRLDVVVLMDLSENQLEWIPEEGFFFWMNAIREMNLSHNKLVSIPVRGCRLGVVGFLWYCCDYYHCCCLPLLLLLLLLPPSPQFRPNQQLLQHLLA